MRLASVVVLATLGRKPKPAARSVQSVMGEGLFHVLPPATVMPAGQEASTMLPVAAVAIVPVKAVAEVNTSEPDRVRPVLVRVGAVAKRPTMPPQP
jgi:hypothetical protein